MKIQKIRENIKKSYQFQNKEIFIHGVTLEGDPVEYEHHTLDNNSKLNAGDDIQVTFSEDKRGNKKITLIKQQKSFGGFKQQDKDEGAITALSIYSSVRNGLQGSTKTQDHDYILEQCEKAWEWVKSKSSR